jgi:hypothetical protein
MACIIRQINSYNKRGILNMTYVNKTIHVGAPIKDVSTIFRRFFITIRHEIKEDLAYIFMVDIDRIIGKPQLYAKINKDTIFFFVDTLERFHAWLIANKIENKLYGDWNDFVQDAKIEANLNG